MAHEGTGTRAVAVAGVRWAEMLANVRIRWRGGGEPEDSGGLATTIAARVDSTLNQPLAALCIPHLGRPI